MPDLTSTEYLGSGGSPFNDVGHYGEGSVREILVHWGKTNYAEGAVLITGFQVRYGDNGWGPQRGKDVLASDSDLSKDSFVLGKGEFITKVEGRTGEKVDALQFHTNKGRSSKLYGGGGGKPFVWEFKGRQLAYFKGAFSDQLDRIQTNWAPIPDDAFFISEADPKGTSTGSPWSHDSLFSDPKTDAITAVKTTWGPDSDNKVVILQIQAKYGSQWTPANGEIDSLIDVSSNTFTLEEDEFIVSIEGRASDKIHALQWVTNKGRTSRIAGDGGASPFTWNGNTPTHLSGPLSKFFDFFKAHWAVNASLYLIYGGKDGTRFTWKGNRLAYFSGTSTKFLESLGAHWLVA